MKTHTKEEFINLIGKVISTRAKTTQVLALYFTKGENNERPSISIL